MRILITILGWAAFNWFKFIIVKDEYDDRNESFPFSAYKDKNWENWVGTAIGATILLVLGQEVFHIIKLSEGFFTIPEGLGWSDAYYLMSGVLTEAAIWAIKSLNRKFTK